MNDRERYFREARASLVDGQVRPNGIIDERILSAFRRLRRERFLPPDLQGRAYADAEVPLGHGRAMTRLMTLGRMLMESALKPQQRALVIAAGTGYGAASLADIGLDVTALEEDDWLHPLAQAALSAEAPEVRLVKGRLVEGCVQHAPYDLILIDGAVDAVPPALAEQLSPEGRLVTIVYRRGVGRLMVGEKVQAAGDTPRFAFRCAADSSATIIPQFRSKPEFVF